MSKLLSNVMNYYAVLAIYKFEMARMRRTLLQSIVTPVLTTSLYFIVFGAAIGSRIQEVGGVGYGALPFPRLRRVRRVALETGGLGGGNLYQRVPNA